MSRTRRALTVLCVCAACVGLSAPAFADTWATGSNLVWPSGADVDSMAEGVPLDTQVWIRTSSFTTWPSYTLRDGAGELVETEVEIITRRESDGPRGHMAILTPAAPLEPDTVYTVSSIDDLRSGSHEYHFPLEEVPFKTGGGFAGAPTLAASDVEYVAHVGLDLQYGGCCDVDEGDSLHAIRWRPLPPDAPWLARLDVTYPGEEPLTTFSVKGDLEPAGALEHIATHSFEKSEFPCVDFTLTDITGHEIATSSSCAPASCTSNPPFRGADSPEFIGFLSDPAQWDAYATPCEPVDDPDPTAQDGCATTPASPIPHTPLALGGFALLGMLARRRSEQ